jgi:hypothetical protein
MSSGNWILEIFQIGGGSDRTAMLEFGSLPLLRVALAEHPGKKFFVTMPDGVTPGDRNALLDLRSQGFDIAIRMA